MLPVITGLAIGFNDSYWQLAILMGALGTAVVFVVMVINLLFWVATLVK